MIYQKIVKLEDEPNIKKLESVELEALGKLWKEKKSELEDSGEYKQFIKKMQREWAIETGIIERLYNWDRGVTETLIEHGVDSSLISHKSGINRDESEHIAKVIEDQLDIVEGLFAFIKGEQPFSEYFIRSMHEQFTSNQDYTEALTPDGKLIKVPLLKGSYKKHANNPKRPDGIVHEYCPAELVEDEMQSLVQEYIKSQDIVQPEVLSAWLHHRFTQIHPFQDGNGRIARAIASLVFLKAGLFPLVIRDSDREEYILSLEQADAGDLSKLVKLFTKRQRDSILSALGIQQQVEQAKHSKQIITNALELLKAKSSKHINSLSQIYTIADKLQSALSKKLLTIKKDINPELKKIPSLTGATYNASVKESKNGDKDSHFFHRQIVDIANIHDYYVNNDNYKAWSRLVLYTEKLFEIVFSIHGHGFGDNGIMVISGFTFEKIPTEDDTMETTNTKPCNQDIFQFNYLESEENILNRFDEWIDESITYALAEWQRTLL